MKRKNTLGLAIAALLAGAPRMALRNDLSGDAKELLNAFNARTDEVKNLALDAQRQSGELKAGFREAIDASLAGQAELRAQMTELQQHVASQLDNSGAQHPVTIGQKFVADQRVSNYLAENKAGNGDPGKMRATFDGYSLRNAVSGNTPASGGVLRTPQYLPGIIQPGITALTIRDLLMWGTTADSSINFKRELAFTNNAAPVSELTTKPQSNIAFEDATAQVVTIAHWVKESKQIVADVPRLQSYIDTRMMRKLREVEEAQLLKGSGVGNNLPGLYTTASAYSNPGVTVTSENRMDRLRLAILQAFMSGYAVDGIVLNPVDVAAIELTKTASDKNYLARSPFTGKITAIWGVPLVESTNMTVGTYLVGAFGSAAQGWDREQMSVQLGYEGTDFIDNAITVLCEERLALTTYRTDAFIKGSFGSVA